MGFRCTNTSPQKNGMIIQNKILPNCKRSAETKSKIMSGLWNNNLKSPPSICITTFPSLRSGSQMSLPIPEHPNASFYTLSDHILGEIFPCRPAAHALFEIMSRFGFYFIFMFLLYKSPSLILALCFAVYVYIHYRTRWNWIGFLFPDLWDIAEVGLHLLYYAMISWRDVCRVFPQHVKSSAVLVTAALRALSLRRWWSVLFQYPSTHELLDKAPV